MKLRICIAGVTGWVGRPLAAAISEAHDLSLVSAVSRTHQGKHLKDVVADCDMDVIIRGSVAEALASQTDVLVDYTKADAVKANVLTAIDRGVHVVIGSSGLTNDDFSEINETAVRHGIGVIAAGNFAITAVLLQRFACEAAKYLSHWEIVDYASDAKMDAPSGTARELAFRLAEVRKPELTHPINATIGEKESRGTALNGSQIHSVRLPGFVIGVEAMFGADNERLSLRHDAGNSAAPYIGGTLLAIRTVKSHVGLIRGLDKIMT